MRMGSEIKRTGVFRFISFNKLQNSRLAGNYINADVVSLYWNFALNLMKLNCFFKKVITIQKYYLHVKL